MKTLAMGVSLKKSKQTQKPPMPGMSSVGKALGDVHLKPQHWGGGCRRIKRFKGHLWLPSKFRASLG